ncbi:hypothetical protein [Tetragenococcus halophilus]|uniref:hypothetical protein n=1 Tax=Tetragenococcus halophilus TaxID=51669 RepID=UPI00300F940F
MKDDYNISMHGRGRIAKRMGIPKKAVDRQFNLAIEKGYRRKDLKGRIVKWMTKIMYKNELSPKEVIVYNNFCFVISKDDVLVTVFSIPSNLSKHINDFVKPEKGEHINV